MALKKWAGRWALVTGASSGIGEEMARQLAAEGVHLVLTARREELLEALAKELEEKNGVQTRVIPLDMTASDAPGILFEKTEGAGIAIELLVNNAGFGNRGDFLDLAWSDMALQLQLNVVALTELSHRFGEAMKARGGGTLLNVASVGGFLPVPGYATYGAGKAYVLSFSEALAVELGPANVTVSALCPGPTRTEFAERAGHHLAAWQEALYAPVGPCARAGLVGAARGERVVVPGLLMKFSVFILRFVPRSMRAWSAGILMK